MPPAVLTGRPRGEMLDATASGRANCMELYRGPLPMLLYIAGIMNMQRGGGKGCPLSVSQQFLYPNVAMEKNLFLRLG